MRAALLRNQDTQHRHGKIDPGGGPRRVTTRALTNSVRNGRLHQCRAVSRPFCPISCTAMSAIEFACKQLKEIPFALTKTQIERIIKIVLKAAHGPGLKGLIQCAKLAFWLDEVIVETSALGQSASDRYPQVAGPIHTILVLAVLPVGRSGIRFLRIN